MIILSWGRIISEMTRRHWKSHSMWQIEPGGEERRFPAMERCGNFSHWQILSWGGSEEIDTLGKAEISSVSFFQTNEFQVWTLCIVSFWEYFPEDDNLETQATGIPDKLLNRCSEIRLRSFTLLSEYSTFPQGWVAKATKNLSKP